MPYIDPPPGFARRMPPVSEAERIEGMKLLAQEAEQFRAWRQSQQDMAQEQVEAQRRHVQFVGPTYGLTQAEMDQVERERQHVARIWQNPTPVNPAFDAYPRFDYGNITPPNLLIGPQPMRPSYMAASYCAPPPMEATAPDAPRPRATNGRGWAYEMPAPYGYDFAGPDMRRPMEMSAFGYAAGYARPATPPRPIRNVTQNEALATWYAGEVISLLVHPGQFRPGVNGQSDRIWSTAARERDSWDRIGQSFPDHSETWVRFGMAPSPRPAYPSSALYNNSLLDDPWRIEYTHRQGPTSGFVSFIHDILLRMSVTPTNVVAAVWYLRGLGLHDTDVKGKQLRELLMDVFASEEEVIERRIAVLGLLLAGKWLDDNSFLAKSWTEVTRIPTVDICQMETAALIDLHFSLHIPLSAWADHCNQAWADLTLVNTTADTDASTVMLLILDTMVNEARDIEMWEPTSPHLSQLEQYDYIDRRLEELYSTENTPEAEDAGAEDPVSQWYTPQPFQHSQNLGLEVEMSMAARNVSAIVDDIVEEEEAEDEDDEDDVFANGEYDGAKRFLPTMSEMRRSSSSSDAVSDSVEAWRSAVLLAQLNQPHSSSDSLSARSYNPDYPFSFDRPRTPPYVPASITADHFYVSDDPRSTHSRVNSSVLRREPIPYDDPGLVERTRSNAGNKRPVVFKETGVVLEPGISQVRPPTAYRDNHERKYASAHTNGKSNANVNANGSQASGSGAGCPYQGYAFFGGWPDWN